MSTVMSWSAFLIRSSRLPIETQIGSVILFRSTPQRLSLTQSVEGRVLEVHFVDALREPGAVRDGCNPRK